MYFVEMLSVLLGRFKFKTKDVMGRTLECFRRVTGILLCISIRSKIYSEV